MYALIRCPPQTLSSRTHPQFNADAFVFVPLFLLHWLTLVLTTDLVGLLLFVTGLCLTGSPELPLCHQAQGIVAQSNSAKHGLCDKFSGASTAMFPRTLLKIVWPCRKQHTDTASPLSFSMNGASQASPLTHKLNRLVQTAPIHLHRPDPPFT